VNTGCVVGLFVKRLGYNWNFGGTRGWKWKMVAENIILLKIHFQSEFTNNATALV
jgi:hypothetical protein